ncbi:MAG: ion channel [Rikenellaceae bacterium]
MEKVRLRNFFDYLVVVTSILLIIAISIEILCEKTHTFTRWYVSLQFWVCLIFIADFFISMFAERNRWRYFWSHLIVLVISLPYLSLPIHNSASLDREGVMLIALMPIFRAFVAIYILLRWIMRGEQARRLLYAYILSVVSFTYVSALLFYDCEISRNQDLGDFGDAIWWAAMALSTTELTIVPVTVTAKILSVALPITGMMMLPIATNFLLSMRNRK